MSTHPRLSPSPVCTGQNAVSRRLRRGPLSAVLLAGIALLLAVLAAPAGAVITTVGSTTVGLQPHNGTTRAPGASRGTFANAGGNPVLHNNNTYAIYWDPTDSYHGDWQGLINGFFSNLGSASGSLTSMFAVDTQYTDKTNQPASYLSTFRGAYTDTNKFPIAGCVDPEPLEFPDAITCLSDKQVREELTHFIAQHALTKGMGTIFYLLTPPGVTVCLDGGGASGHCSDSEGGSPASFARSFCSYHGAINPGGLATGDANTVLYGMIPWSAGGLGDFHLQSGNQTQAYDCQDGGFDASHEEEREKAKEKTSAQEKEFEEKTAEEKAKAKKEEELEGPHQQEPNQSGRGPDGSFDTGLADLIVNQIGVEQQNIVTNPLLNAWHDETNKESTDECRNQFDTGAVSGAVTGDIHTGAGNLSNVSLNGGGYYINQAFNLAAVILDYPGVPCLGFVNLVPSFTAPNPVNTGDIVGFDGMESNVALNAGIKFSAGGAPELNLATYTWNFGDGTPVVSGFAPGSPSQNAPELTQCEAPWIAPCAGSVFHSYQYGGIYETTLTIRDVGGHTASVTKSITVNGPARPVPAPEPAPAPAPSVPGVTGGGSTTSGGSGSGTPGTHARPVATQAVTSHSLASVLRGGLVINYSVNEQVAGRFEVLLASSIARRIGLHGPAATGLAKGTAAQMVIAKAVLVTTKGGHSTYKIKFSKATAAHLRKLKKVSLMIRLVVHNASSPVVTTVLNTVNLSR